MSPALLLRPASLALTFLLSTAVLAPCSVARTWTDAQGRTVEADFVRATADSVTIRRDDGRLFDFPLDRLSAADRDFVAIQAAPPPAGAPTFTALDIDLGLPLLADDSLWDDPPAEVAARLKLPLEGRTELFESYRAYPKNPFTVFGAPAYTIGLQAGSGRVEAVHFIFTNRGDYAAFRSAMAGARNAAQAMRDFGGALDADFDAISSRLTFLFGSPAIERAAGGLEPGRRSLRWDFGPHRFVLSREPDQMVSLAVIPVDSAGARRLSDDQIRHLLADRLDRRPTGDVIVDRMPMVSQGPKGYCVPATFERYLRYVGIPADMYELAAVGGTRFGGGTDMRQMVASLDHYVRRYDRHIEQLDLRLSAAGVSRCLDEGRPIIWGLSTTPAFNQLSNRLTARRRTVTDWPAWKRDLAALDLTPLRLDAAHLHACLIIGYNRATDEIAFTDSWGPDYAERWVPAEAARRISLDQYWAIAW